MTPIKHQSDSIPRRFSDDMLTEINILEARKIELEKLFLANPVKFLDNNTKEMLSIKIRLNHYINLYEYSATCEAPTVLRYLKNTISAIEKQVFSGDLMQTTTNQIRNINSVHKKEVLLIVRKYFIAYEKSIQKDVQKRLEQG